MASMSRKLPPKCIIAIILERGEDKEDWKFIIFTNAINPRPVEADDWHFIYNVKNWVTKQSWDDIVEQYSVQKKELGGFFNYFINYNYKLVANIRAMRYLRDQGYKFLFTNRKGEWTKASKGDYKVNFTKRSRLEDE